MTGLDSAEIPDKSGKQLRPIFPNTPVHFLAGYALRMDERFQDGFDGCFIEPRPRFLNAGRVSEPRDRQPVADVLAAMYHIGMPPANVLGEIYQRGFGRVIERAHGDEEIPATADKISAGASLFGHGGVIHALQGAHPFAISGVPVVIFCTVPLLHRWRRAERLGKVRTATIRRRYLCSGLDPPALAHCADGVPCRTAPQEEIQYQRVLCLPHPLCGRRW